MNILKAKNYVNHPTDENLMELEKVLEDYERLSKENAELKETNRAYAHMIDELAVILQNVQEALNGHR